MIDLNHALDRNSSTPDQTPSEQTPERAAWSPAAIRLLQGAIYFDESPTVWEATITHVEPLAHHFIQLGLQLIVDEREGMAYLKPFDQEEDTQDNANLPRLFRRVQLSFEATLCCVLLRDLLHKFEEEDMQNDRCIVSQAELFGMWAPFFADETDEVKSNRSLTSQLRKLEDLKLIRQFSKDPLAWEIRRILKARLPIESLERLRESLTEADNTKSIIKP